MSSSDWSVAKDNPVWNTRSRMIAAWIEPNSSVFEFGCWTGYLKKVLPSGCQYAGSDLYDRGFNSVADLNLEIPEVPKVDYVVIAGVLEYLRADRVPLILDKLRHSTTKIILSYTFKWYGFTYPQFVKMAASVGWEETRKMVYADQTRLILEFHLKEAGHA